MADQSVGIDTLTRGIENLNTLDIQIGGDDQATWEAPSGEQGISFNHAVRKLFESGGLPAKPFATKTLMTASTLANGSYAQVTDDTVNNGLYLKTAGVWSISQYSTQTLLTDVIENSIYDTADNGAVFAFADSDGKVGVEFDKDANVNANNIHSLQGNYMHVFLDADNRLLMAIDSNGDLKSKTIDAIYTEIDSLSNIPVNEDAGIKNQKTDYMHLFSYGQSLSRGTTASPVISTTQPYSNVTFNSGVLSRLTDDHDWSAFKPLVEATVGGDGESPVSGFANNFVRKKVADGGDATKWVMLGTSPAAGGQPIENLVKGKTLYTGLVAQVQAAYDVAQGLGKSYSVWSMAWTQGETDYINLTTYDVYYEKLSKLHDDFSSDVMSITKQKFIPPLISYQTAANRRYEKNTLSISQAQLQLSIDKRAVVLATPIYHLPHNTDNLHLTADSSEQLGRYYAKALDYTLESKDKWQPLRPVNILAQGKIIDIEFSKSGLIFDTTLVALTHNKGFDVWSASNELVDIITSVSVVDSNRVRIVLSQNLPNNSVLSYAKGRNGDPAKSGNLEGARGNLRDNAGATDSYQDSKSVTRYMHNWCVHFEQSL